MKKSILTVILIISAVFCAFGQNSGPIDLILLLDTSSAMGSSYERVNDYITGAFLSEFLRTGDTFHLITFSAAPSLDIARRVSARGDLETIIGRMLIQYPIETGYDARAAISYAEEYAASLPQRPKKIVMVCSDGSDRNNLVNVARQRLSSKNTTLDLVSVTGGQPLANIPSSGRPASSNSQQRPPSSGPSAGSSAIASNSSTASGTTPATGTAVSTPLSGAVAPGSSTAGSSTASTQGGASTTQTTTQGASTTQITAQQGTIQTDAQSTKQQPTASSSDSSAVRTDAAGTEPSAQEVSSAGGGKSSANNKGSVDNSTGKDSASEQNYDSSGTASTVTQTSSQKQKNSIGSFFNPRLLMIIGVIAALLLLILFIIFALRRLGLSPNRVMASVSASSRPEKKERITEVIDHSKELASYAAIQSKKRVTPYSNKPVNEQIVKQPVINPAGPLLLNLFVEDQSTSIGKRNIHSLKSGYSLSIGGGKSDDFLVFLVPMPSHLGEIRRNGSQLTFIPRKPKYFPDIGSNEVKDCINKRIRIVSDKNYEMWFSFIMYEDPLVALNRVLNSIKVPG